MSRVTSLATPSRLRRSFLALMLARVGIWSLPPATARRVY